MGQAYGPNHVEEGSLGRGERKKNLSRKGEGVVERETAPMSLLALRLWPQRDRRQLRLEPSAGGWSQKETRFFPRASLVPTRREPESSATKGGHFLSWGTRRERKTHRGRNRLQGRGGGVDCHWRPDSFSGTSPISKQTRCAKAACAILCEEGPVVRGALFQCRQRAAT